MKGYLQEKVINGRLMSWKLLNTKNISLKKINHICKMCPYPIHRSEENQNEHPLSVLDWGSSNETDPALREGEMHVLLASVCTWMFSARGHTYVATME